MTLKVQYIFCHFDDFMRGVVDLVIAQQDNKLEFSIRDDPAVQMFTLYYTPTSNEMVNVEIKQEFWDAYYELCNTPEWSTYLKIMKHVDPYV